MKKEKIKTILIVLIILILCLNIGVYAATVLSATDVTYTKSDGTTVSVSAALDELNTKIPIHEIGDEVTVGGEQFYVLEWDNNSDTVNLIAKYNLNSNGDAQSSAGVTCAFSSTYYWQDSFTSNPFNLNDCIGFTETDALGKAKSYGRSKGAVSSRLLSYEEANALKAKIDSNSKIRTMLNANAKSYWLGSAGWKKGVWYIYNAWDFNYFDGFTGKQENGVRPVITVLKSSIS